MRTRISAALVAVILSGPAFATEEMDPEFEDPKRVCEQLTDAIRTIADGFIEGDFSARLEVALAAFDRIPCNPRRLLAVLNINPEQ